MLTSGVCLLHDNARPYIARPTVDFFDWDVLTHPPHSPDLAPSNYHLFTKPKEVLAEIRHQNDDEVMLAVWNWGKDAE